MADSKITALTAISTVDPAADPLVIVDVSDTSMAASGTTKKGTINQLLGAGGTATLASATITGDLTVDTSTLKVDSALNNVGIGTASPNNNTNRTSLTLNNASWGGQLDINVGATNHAQFGTDNFSSGASCRIQSKDHIAFKTNNGSVLGAYLNSNGSFALQNANTAANGIGVTFPATQSASTDANTLDDYEEGTWTGTLTGGTTNPTTPVTATGRYTKVGRVVTVQITFLNANTTGASGLIGITGLPFANNGSSSSTGAVSLYLIGTFTGNPFASLGVNESFINFFANVSGGAFTDVTHNAGTPRFLTTSITYTV